MLGGWGNRTHRQLGCKQAEGGSTRWGRAVCGLRSPLKRYLSDVEVKLHNMHMHDQVFITNNDEHVEEIAMKQ